MAGAVKPENHFPSEGLDEMLEELLERAYHKDTAEVCLQNLSRIAENFAPVDLARAVQHLPPRVRPILFLKFDTSEKRVEFLINTDDTTRNVIFRHLNIQESKTILDNTPPDEAVHILESLSEKRTRILLETMDPVKAARVRELKSHREKSAGRLMTNEFFAFAPETCLRDVKTCIRNNPGIEFTQLVFVVDEDGVLEGIVPERNLLVNGDSIRLAQVMHEADFMVDPSMPREEVIELVERYKLQGLPVVDDEGRLMGIITQEDVLEAMEDVADATMAAMAGTGEKVSESEPLFHRFLARAPWLFVTLFAGLLNMCVMTLFQEYEKGFLTFVFFFVPLITGMSGNIGLQCSTVLVRNMALGLVTKSAKKDFIAKELTLGLISGATFGLITALFVFILNSNGIQVTTTSPGIVGVVVGVGLFGACIAGTVLGVFSPLFFSRIGIDPAVASGPIITAFNDFLSMSIYFIIAAGLTRSLLT